MTSLKKPIIAIAAAVALAGTMLFAGPANASSATLTVAGASPATAGTASASAIALPVPSDNDVSSADALRIALSGVTAGTNVAVTATNAKIVTAVSSGSTIVKVDSGVSTATIPTGTGTTADVYVYTTTTETGTVAVTANGNTTTYYVKGTAGSAYNLTVVAPAVANLSAAVEVTATVTDVFGNAVTGATISSTVIRGSIGSFSYDSTDKRYEATLTAPATAGTTVIANTITASAVTGLAKPVTEVVSNISVADLAGQVAVLQAQVASMVTKDKYNKLAKKWNKKFPKSKVQLVK
jgi:adhesin/invasin